MQLLIAFPQLKREQLILFGKKALSAINRQTCAFFYLPVIHTAC